MINFPPVLTDESTSSLFFVISQKVNGILIEVLPPMIVAHDGLWVMVFTHHLHLPVADMIAYRCEQAEIKNPFADEAVELIYTQTGGVPRQVLQVCALSYDMGQRAGVDKLPLEIVEMAAQEAVYHDDDLEDE